MNTQKKEDVKVKKKNRAQEQKSQAQDQKSQDIFSNLAGQQIVIVGKNGVIYKGILKGKPENGFFILSKTTICGKEYESDVPFVLIDRNHAAHIHPEAQEVRKRDE